MNALSTQAWLPDELLVKPVPQQNANASEIRDPALPAEMIILQAKSWSRRRWLEKSGDTITSQEPVRGMTNVDADAPRLSLPKIEPLRRLATFSPIQEWEGHIAEIGETSVIAYLTDLTARERHPSERAEIPLAEFSERDVKKLKPGSVFRWAIGYFRQPQGTKMRVSQLVLRDLPQWTKSDQAAGYALASGLAEYLAGSHGNEQTGDG